MKIVLSHVFGFANKGDLALLESLLDVIHREFPRAKLFGICRDPLAQHARFPQVKWVKAYGSTEGNGISRKLSAAGGLAAGLFEGFVQKWRKKKNKNGAAQIISEETLVILSPGGYFEDTLWSFYSNALHLWLAVRLARNVILAPQTIGPIDSRMNRAILRRLLRNVHSVFVRDEYSRAFLLQYNLVDKKQLFYSLDMAFYATIGREGIKTHRYDGDLLPESYISITPIDWYFPTSEQPKAMQESYLASLARAIDMFWTEFGLQTLLLPQIESAFGVVGDRQLLQKIQEQTCLKSAISLDPTVTLAELRQCIGGARLHIGSRMHSTIFALAEGTPTIGISYLPKMTSMFEQLGIGEFCIDIEDTTAEVLSAKGALALNRSEDFSALRERLNDEALAGRTIFVNRLRDAIGSYL